MLNASADPHKRAATNCATNAIISAKARGFKPLEHESQGYLHDSRSGSSQDY
jgi:hypothetical protein